MAEKGWAVIRVTNEDVYKRLDGVLDMIAQRVPVRTGRVEPSGEGH